MSNKLNFDYCPTPLQNIEHKQQKRYEIQEQQKQQQQEQEKQFVYTVTRTYIAPNGSKKTKTHEYYGDEAQKLINEMKEREKIEKEHKDDEIINNIEDQFEHITNPEQWLDYGFKCMDNNNNNNNKKKQHGDTNKIKLHQHQQQHHSQSPSDQQQQQQPQIQSCQHNGSINNQPIQIINEYKLRKGCVPTKSHSSNYLFIKEALDEHNRLRNIHHVPYLKLNRDLCMIAQEWADQVANSGKFEHSNNKYLNQSLGENIAMRFTSTGEELDGKQMTQQWYEEAADYDFNLDFQPGKGHFAQIVWKNTREVGFGRAQSKDGKWYAVANYYPAGNYINHFRENVFPPSTTI